MNKISEIIEFMKVLEKLCQVERDNKMTGGRYETDSDHIMKLCYLIMMVYPYFKTKVDYLRLLELALVHDLAEAQTGDYSLSAQNAHPDLKVLKKQREKEAVAYYKSILPSPLNERIYDLFMEYEERTTREAKIVYVLDKLEAHLQANQYHEGDIRYWAEECDGGEWYYQCATTRKPMIKELDEEVLSDLETAVIKITQRNLDKCGIKICE